MSAKERMQKYEQGIFLKRNSLSEEFIELLLRSDLDSEYTTSNGAYIFINRRGICSFCSVVNFQLLVSEPEARKILGFYVPKGSPQTDIEKLQSSLMRRDGGEFKLFEESDGMLFGKVTSEANKEWVACAWKLSANEWRASKIYDTVYDLIPRKKVYCADLFDRGIDKLLLSNPYAKDDDNKHNLNLTSFPYTFIKTIEFEL